MRMLAPNERRNYVKIAELEPGKLYFEREATVYLLQANGIPLRPGIELRAYIDSENKAFSVLEIDSTPR